MPCVHHMNDFNAFVCVQILVPATGQGTRKRPVELPFPQPKPQQTTKEDDNRWQEIIKRSGLLKINGQVSIFPIS